MIKLLLSVIIILAILLVLELFRFTRGKKKAEQAFSNNSFSKIASPGETTSLEIIPLIDWYTDSEKLKGEAGVSYLIKTDNHSILFDLGFNYPSMSDPSPLQQNMQHLGIELDDIDTLVISHNHPDHVGGRKWQRKKSFSFSATQIDLGPKKVYAPVKLSYPGLDPVCMEKPGIIAKGVYSIGAIPNQLFFAGRTLELALAVNVKNKGIVLIVGCGHQTLEKILLRAEALFDEPIHGIVGGLHYPVTDSRLKLMGFKVQKYLATGKAPWQTISASEVQENINLLKKRAPKLVAISAHDSCNQSLDMFRTTFPKTFQTIKVGKKITV